MGSVTVFVLITFYSSPLSVVYDVIRTKNSASLLWPLGLANLITSLLWAAYGIAIKDWFIIGPNAVGILTGLVQLFLCVIFPRKPMVSPDIPSATSAEGIVITSVDSASIDSASIEKKISWSV
ncbi:hypothetical protein HK102_013283 [Quaeritorhiza haematococci]|nr:hypothetical protein HK102_013283 [Quaeritorhiza haematococci]